MSKIKVFALGGLNEYGKNMYVVEVDKDIFVFDAGLKYNNNVNLGVDYIIPDTTYLENNVDRIKGIFLSHGHLSSVGAVPDIFDKLKNVDIYGTKLTLDVLKTRMSDSDKKKIKLKEIKPHTKIEFGKNSVFPIRVTHSIPDAVCYVLNTPDGAIVYTGDFVFDSTMLGKYKTDIGKLAYVGKQGVLLLLSESVYAWKEGYTSPKNRVSDFIREVLAHNENRIITTVLPTDFYRIQEIFDEVSEAHRKIVIMGKELGDLVKKGIDDGYLKVGKKVIGDLKNVDDKNVVILISSDNERPFANLERILKDRDKYIKIKDTDMVFIAEPASVGMEKKYALIMDEVAIAGANAISLSTKKHLLAHASREDLMLMINLMNPKYYMPVKGEYRYQFMNAALAEELDIPKENIILKENGDVVELDNGELVENFEKIPIDSILIDGKDSEDIGDLVLKDREMLGENGIVLLSCTLDKTTKKILAGPEILTRGFIYVKESQDLLERTKEIAKDVIANSIDYNAERVDYTLIKNEVRKVLGKFFYDETESKPMIITVIQEV